MEGRWDRPRDHARTLGECDGKDEPLAEGNKDDDDEYGKDSNIPDDNDEYAVGIDGVGNSLDEGDDQRCPRTSVPCESAAKHALLLRASYSQWAGAESMILSARSESIILSVPPAESMILSQRQHASMPSR